MIRIILCGFLLGVSSWGVCQEQTPTPADAGKSVEEANKALARAFYEDLWFSDRTDRFEEYVADEYVLHDTGDLKNVTEPAVKQKEVPDFLRSQGEMGGEIDFQIAEGDLVATRWRWKFKPKTLMFRILGGREEIPVINVFRIRDGKIVEIWNHRHDIDTGRANIGFVMGLVLGGAIMFAVWMVCRLIGSRRKKRASASV